MTDPTIAFYMTRSYDRFLYDRSYYCFLYDLVQEWYIYLKQFSCDSPMRCTHKHARTLARTHARTHTDNKKIYVHAVPSSTLPRIQSEILQVYSQMIFPEINNGRGQNLLVVAGKCAEAGTQ